MPSHFRIRPHLHRLIFAARPRRQTGLGVAAGFIALNLLLFVPLYLVFSYENHFTPFFPLGHPRGPYVWRGPELIRSVYEYAMQLFVRRHNLDIFRVSADWVLIASFVILASRFAKLRRKTAVSFAWCGYAFLFTFLMYSAFIHDLRAHPAALIDDMQLLYSGWVFIRNTWTPTYLLYVAVFLGAAVGGGAFLARYLSRLWRWQGGAVGSRPLVAVCVIVNVYATLSLSWFGVERNDPIIQLQAKHIYYNWRRSWDVVTAVRILNSSSVSRLAARAADVAPVRRPDIYLFEVESYGAAWWVDPDYEVARQGLVRKIERNLEELQLPILSRFATAPVHGGGSWMSTASVLSGMKIDTQTVYSAWKRLARRYPHLISYLNRNEYYTLAVQPGTMWIEDIYEYDDTIIQTDFSYDGPVYSFGVIPDQWALDVAFTNHWTDHASPRLMHFLAVSTHFAWHPPPRITERVEELRAPQEPFIETRPDYAELARTVPKGRKRDYFVTMAYEWELLLDVFRRRVQPGFIALIFGDHQAPFITDGYGGDDVVLHVVTDLADYPRLLAEVGFAGGAEPPAEPSAAVPLRMEGFYSLLLSLLVTSDGEALEFSPNGLDLAPLEPDQR